MAPIRYGLEDLVNEVPDGNIIIHFVEVVFQPNFTGEGATGIHASSFPGKMKSDVYIRKELYVNVVLSSGTTMFQEIVERMTDEPTTLAPFTTKIRVVAPSK